jgi:NAD(P)-dependent dehydrogenase (short-subunit alcohol dehydrogenase family)
MTTTSSISTPLVLDSTALVTGATSGIGRATAIRLAARGHRVVVAGRSSARATEIVEGIRAAGGRAEAATADLGDAGQVLHLARAALQAGQGRVDVLVNDAATYPPLPGATAGTTAEAIDAAFATNVRAPYLLMRELTPGMAERGRGTVVNLISTAASAGMPRLGLYGATKAALAQLTAPGQQSSAPRACASTRSAPAPQAPREPRSPATSSSTWPARPQPGGVAAPEEIAAAIDFLVSDDASFIHGVVLPVDGGRLAV